MEEARSYCANWQQMN